MAPPADALPKSAPWPMVVSDGYRGQVTLGVVLFNLCRLLNVPSKIALVSFWPP
jgi:hypothetical protein